MSADPRPAVPFASVAVIGLGVMGGSLVKALSGLADPPRRVGWSPDPREGGAALSDGVLDEVAPSGEDAARGAELVVLAAPLGACLEWVPRVHAVMAPDAVLTDVASLKGRVGVAVARAGAQARWVGSHPMCGRAESGFRASAADLYEGALTWIVGGDAPPESVARVEAFWHALGSHTRRTSSAAHDALMSFTSHLPQLTATALAGTLEEAGLTAPQLGPGGADMTRLAASSPEMWRDILAHGFHPGLVEALRVLSGRTATLADLIEAGDFDAVASLMASTRTWKNGPS